MNGTADNRVEADVRLRAGSFALDLELSARQGITVLFGPSGSGKSLTLRAIAGILRPEAGRIVVCGKTVFDQRAGIDLAPHARGIGYAGQRAALFPHLSVAGNVAFGLHGLPPAQRMDVVRAWLERLELSGFGSRRTKSLSGGQAQRVALARALAPGHRVLLLDEPFSALDEVLRQGLRELLSRLSREEELTILFVTHDLREAYFLADELVVIDAGRILQSGPRDEVFRKPASRRVAELLGAANLLRGTVVHRTPDALHVEVAGWRALVGSWSGEPNPGDLVDVVIRPERIVIRRGEPAESNILPSSVVRELDYGPNRLLEFVPDSRGPRLVVDIASRPYEVLGIANKKHWALELPPHDLHAIATDASRRDTTQ